MRGAQEAKAKQQAEKKKAASSQELKVFMWTTSKFPGEEAKKLTSDTSGSCEGKPAVAKGKADKAGTVGQDLFR